MVVVEEPENTAEIMKLLQLLPFAEIPYEKFIDEFHMQTKNEAKSFHCVFVILSAFYCEIPESDLAA
jgi:hypothetical protein